RGGAHVMGAKAVPPLSRTVRAGYGCSGARGTGRSYRRTVGVFRGRAQTALSEPEALCMADARERLMDDVRRAVAAGNRSRGVPRLPERGAVGYQGAAPDPVRRFCAELAAAGGRAHVVPDAAAAREAVVRLVRESGLRRAVVGGGPVIDGLGLADALR